MVSSQRGDNDVDMKKFGTEIEIFWRYKRGERRCQNFVAMRLGCEGGITTKRELVAITLSNG